MYIVSKKGIDIHWWGNSLLVIDHLTDFYTLAPEETLLLKYFSVSNDIDKTIETMANDLEIEKSDIAIFIEIFLENFSSFFQKVSSSNVEKINLTGKEGLFYPLELHVSLTNACSHHCIHCYKSAQRNGTYIDITALKNFLDKMCGYVPYLTLSGGEPTLHPHFVELLKEYRDKFYISVLTSGYNIDALILDSLKGAQLGVTVSIYSYDAIKHDAFTGIKGSFQSILGFLVAAMERNIPVNVSTILTNDNREDVQRLIAYLEKTGVRSISVGRIAPLGRASKGQLYSTSPDRNNFIAQVTELANKYTSVEIWPEDTQISQENAGAFRCPAGTFIWAICENGEIQPCAVCPKPELKISDIDCFDDAILYDRSAYEKRISKMPYMQLSKDHPCPFAD